MKPLNLVDAFRNGEGRHQMRLMMAQQLEELEAATTGGEGSTLLEGRNEKCLEVLQREIGDGVTNLGIYYGAAHLPHMERRLTEDLGFRKVDHDWIVAWDCTKRLDPKVDLGLWRLRREAKSNIAKIALAVQKWSLDHDDEVPSLEQLRELRDDGRPYWKGSQQDPWGGDYAISKFQRAPHFDVHCKGQDGIALTDDDIHSATPRELRRMLRDAERRREPNAVTRAIYEAAKLFKIQNNRVPTMADLETKDDTGRIYLDERPIDSWGNEYVIRELGKGRFEVRCAGADGEFDTADDVTAPKR